MFCSEPTVVELEGFALPCCVTVSRVVMAKTYVYHSVRQQSTQGLKTRLAMLRPGDKLRSTHMIGMSLGCN